MNDVDNFMSWKEIAELHQMGFEIGNHTQNHTHVNKMDSLRFVAELKYIENKCAEYHIPKPISFAYPGYDTSPKALPVLKAAGYVFARQGLNRPYDPLTMATAVAALAAVAFGAIYFPAQRAARLDPMAALREE